MTIKDIELRSGMTRANIRYYESLGLLSPTRGENGYRDYSEADLDTLLKIKLLRSLEVSLEDIGSLSRGEAELGEILSRQMDTLEAKEQELTQARELCRQMRSDCVDYQSLDAEHYLDLMRVRSEAMARVREMDTVEKVARPFHRFFARNLDLYICSVLINLALLLIFDVNTSNLDAGPRFLLGLFDVVLMLFTEPLLLHTWGTTPGKWIMGLYVRCYDGRKPDYYEGLYRTWGVIRYGYGFFIPFYELYRLYRSCTDCSDDGEVPWEDDCLVCMRDDKPWRWAALVGGYALCFGITVLATITLVMPYAGRGEINTEQFVKSYNEMSEFMGYDTTYELNTDGEFVKPSNVAVIEIGSFGEPKFTFHEENGVLTGLTISKEVISSHVWPQSCGSYISIASQVFILARSGGLVSDDMEPLIDWLNEHPFEDFSFDIRGYTLEADYEFHGYHATASSGVLYPDDSREDQYFSLVFTINPEK